MTRLCVLGPSGRMGAAVLAAARSRDDVDVVAALDHPSSPLIGTTLPGNVLVTADATQALADAEAYIDFSTPAATAAVARAAKQAGVAGIVGTTGLNADAEAALNELSAVAPVLWAPNFSLGVNLLLALCETAARALGPEYDLEVFELHHRRKLDAPSGTALALGEALARGRGLRADAIIPARTSVTAPRPTDEVGMAVLRGGDVIGDHTAFLIGEEERIELIHRAQSRTVFAAGAVRAAAWSAGRAPGRYAMKDVLGL